MKMKFRNHIIIRMEARVDYRVHVEIQIVELRRIITSGGGVRHYFGVFVYQPPVKRRHAHSFCLVRLQYCRRIRKWKT